MTPMTPSAYKARYESLQVSLADGTQEVKVNQYRLRGLTGHDVDEAASSAFANALKKNKIDIDLRVYTGADTGAEKVDSSFLSKIGTMARYVFVGKGAPEHCQIVLQLVDHWKLAPAGKHGLQQYADKALGLDCNGFVGNYLWHIGRGESWSSLGVGNLDQGPDLHIDDYFSSRKAIKRWEDLIPTRSYIMGKVDPSTGLVIKGGGSVASAGHIVITEPGHPLRGSTPGQAPAVWVVECTAAHDPGLWESYYGFEGVSRSGIFKLNREQMISGHQHFQFKIAAV
jgi:hypothetical protein